MQNPFRAALEKSGLAQHKFALLLGVNAMTSRECRQGRIPSPASRESETQASWPLRQEPCIKDDGQGEHAVLACPVPSPPYRGVW